MQPHQIAIPFIKPDKVSKPFYVITSIFNPIRFSSRWDTYFKWEKHILDSGAHLITVEAAFGDREFVITKPYNERHQIINVRAASEIWLKENLNNIGTRYLPDDCEYFAFMDADIFMMSPTWVDDVIHKLQHFPIVQMFHDLIYLGPRGEYLYTRVSFARKWIEGAELKYNGKVVQKPVASIYGDPYNDKDQKDKGEWGPPGGCWAYRRKEYEECDGLIDFCILGAADWYMAAGICGFMDQVLAPHSDGYRDALLQWERKALKAFRKNIGMLDQTVAHHWHGKNIDRGYGDREQILKNAKFNPATDLKTGSNGVIKLHDDGSERMRILAMHCHQYFDRRNEDSVDK